MWPCRCLANSDPWETAKVLVAMEIGAAVLKADPWNSDALRTARLSHRHQIPDRTILPI